MDCKEDEDNLIKEETMPIYTRISCRWDDLTDNSKRAVIRIQKAFPNRKIFITSTGQGIHCDNSFHYLGEAFDLEKDGVIEKNKATILKACGQGWQVIIEATHIHCEYDPK